MNNKTEAMLAEILSCIDRHPGTFFSYGNDEEGRKWYGINIHEGGEPDSWGVCNDFDTCIEVAYRDLPWIMQVLEEEERHPYVG